MTKVWFLTLLLILPSVFTWSAEEGEINPLTLEAQLSPHQLGSGGQATLLLKLSLLEGFKAYEDQFSLEIESPKDIKIGKAKIEGGFDFFDKFSKKNRRGIKHSGQLAYLLELPLQLNPGKSEMKLNLKYQACAETYCLFPKSVEIKVPYLVEGDLFVSERNSNNQGIMQNTFEEAKERGLIFVFLFVFVAGVLTSLTPCILPMLPITIAILGKGHPARKKRTRFLHSLVYVLGMATTYSLLGLLAASSGALFGQFLSHPAVQGFFAFLFIAMGVAAFGFFEVQTPIFLQNKVNKISRIPGNFGLFVAGLFSGVIAGPCVGPVLVGVLTFVAQSQDLWLGFWLLFIYAIGMGQLLIILGVSTHLLDRMPRNSQLMKASKVFLGVALISAGVFYISLIWPKTEVFKGPVQEESYQKLPWKPYSETELSKATQAGRPVIIDFFADWCLACKELEYNTFSDPRVQGLSTKITLLKFDATNNSPELVELRKKYGIVGLPSLIFIDKKGQWQKSLTLNEFEKADLFINRMIKLLAF